MWNHFRSYVNVCSVSNKQCVLLQVAAKYIILCFSRDGMPPNSVLQTQIPFVILNIIFLQNPPEKLSALQGFVEYVSSLFIVASAECNTTSKSSDVHSEYIDFQQYSLSLSTACPCCNCLPTPHIFVCRTAPPKLIFATTIDCRHRPILSIIYGEQILSA